MDFPIIKINTPLYGNLYAWGSLFVIISIIVICIIESFIRCRVECVINMMKNKQYKFVILIIFCSLFLAYICARFVSYQLLCALSNCTWYHITISILIVPLNEKSILYLSQCM